MEKKNRHNFSWNLSFQSFVRAYAWVHQKKAFNLQTYKVVFILYLQYKLQANHAYSVINAFLLSCLEQENQRSLTYFTSNCPWHLVLVCFRTRGLQECSEIQSHLKWSMTVQAWLSQVMELAGNEVCKPLWGYRNEECLWTGILHPHPPKNQALGTIPEYLFNQNTQSKAGELNIWPIMQ